MGQCAWITVFLLSVGSFAYSLEQEGARVAFDEKQCFVSERMMLIYDEVLRAEMNDSKAISGDVEVGIEIEDPEPEVDLDVRIEF